MKNTRKAHLWIGLIASIFIFMESITGLLMNEPWLIGQTQQEGFKGNFQQGQMNQGQFNRGQFNQGQAGQGVNQNSGQNAGQAQGQTGNQAQRFSGNGQFRGRGNFGGNGNFPAGMARERMGQTSAMGIIRGLHEGRIGNTDIKWLIDLIALAMIALTGTGIYLSIKVLGAESKRKKRETEKWSDI